MYGRNADAVREAVLAARPELRVLLNPQKPRRNSFEVTLMEGKKGCSAEHILYEKTITMYVKVPLKNMSIVRYTLACSH